MTKFVTLCISLLSLGAIAAGEVTTNDPEFAGTLHRALALYAAVHPGGAVADADGRLTLTDESGHKFWCAPESCGTDAWFRMYKGVEDALYESLKLLNEQSFAKKELVAGFTVSRHKRGHYDAFGGDPWFTDLTLDLVSSSRVTCTHVEPTLGAPYVSGCAVRLAGGASAEVADLVWKLARQGGFESPLPVALIAKHWTEELKLAPGRPSLGIRSGGGTGVNFFTLRVDFTSRAGGKTLKIEGAVDASGRYVFQRADASNWVQITRL